MEDRQTPGLYLEMTDLGADDYATTRVPDVLAISTVRRATWWENVHRDRADLPRVLPEFGLLGVYETEISFVAPDVPDGISAHEFRRTPRPGQGRLTGRPTVGLSLVLISPTEPSRAQELRDWADFVHLRHIAEVGVPGYAMVTPYEQVRGDDPRFLHFYEMDTDDPETAFLAMTPLVRERLADRDEFRRWAGHEALRIMYVNSFRRVGERSS
jgi:hypothetical protein